MRLGPSEMRAEGGGCSIVVRVGVLGLCAISCAVDAVLPAHGNTQCGRKSPPGTNPARHPVKPDRPLQYLEAQNSQSIADV